MSQWGKFCLAAGLLLPLSAHAGDLRSYDKASFYFSAHQDDWQLFMNPSAFQDVADPKTKTVFVYLTAGDAGSGMGARGRKHPFYLARENGAEAAVRFMADADNMPIASMADTRTFRGHSIYRVSYRNTVSYFLRVPDGNVDGSGYPGTKYESLSRFAEGKIKKMHAIDGSATYRGWADLTSTIRAVVDYERGAASTVQINVGETDPKINPEDHPDHQMTAKAALEAVGDLACARRLYFVDYASSKLPENLDAKQRDMESAVFAVNAASIRAFDHSSSWHHYNDSFVGRNYFRVEEGKGTCQAPSVEMAKAPRAAADTRTAVIRRNNPQIFPASDNLSARD
jgi:LmbE family N-acetylglucosaminyl deacetylase